MGREGPAISPIFGDMAKDPYLESTQFRNFGISRKIIRDKSAMEASEATSIAAEWGRKAPISANFRKMAQDPFGQHVFVIP